METLNWIQNYPPLLCLLLEVIPEGNFNIAHGAVRYNYIPSLIWINEHYGHLLEALLPEEGNIAHMALRKGHIDVLNWIKCQDHLRHLLTDKDA